MTSDNIRAGDVVVCIDGFDPPEPTPQPGRLYRVTDTGNEGDELGPFFGLELAGLEPWLWAASKFRKIEPAEDCFTKAIRELLPLEKKVA